MDASRDDRSLWLATQIVPHEGALRDWLSRLAGVGADQVDDLVQETYAVLATRPDVAAIHNPRAYAFQVARSILLQQLRRARVVTIGTLADLEQIGETADDLTPEQHAIARDEYARVAQANVGSVTSRGVEIGATWKIARPLSLIASYSYNDSKYDDDTVKGTALVPTKGVRPVDTPAHLAKGEINYDDGVVFGNFSGSYTSKRNVTYTGDVTVPGYTVFDAAIGYRFKNDGLLKGVELEVTATNLFDKRYIGPLGSGQFFNDATSLNNTMQAGAPREVFGTIRKRF